jgi:Protein of unknown function (DUF4235)
MANPVGKLGFKLVTIAVSIPVGILARKGVEKLWHAARPNDPPHSPSEPGTSWGNALGWAALSAIGVAAAELVSLKGAAEIWRTLTGSEPPVKPGEEPKAKTAKSLAAGAST